jgi:hypothetical protein
VKEHPNGTRAIGMAAPDKKGHLQPHVFTRRLPEANDVHIQVQTFRGYNSFCNSVNTPRCGREAADLQPNAASASGSMHTPEQGLTTSNGIGVTKLTISVIMYPSICHGMEP